MGGIVDGQTIVDRARSAIGTCDYKLARGGRSAVASLPGESWYDKAQKRQRVSCDCSGFVAWCLRRARSPQPDFGKWWLSTDSIWSDANGILTKTRVTQRRLFKRVELSEAQPGDIVVYPDRYNAAGKKLGEGHVGILVDVEKRLIVDCSSSRKGIKERVGTMFFDMGREGFPLKQSARQVICRYNQQGW